MKDEQIILLLKNKQYTKAGEKLYAYFPVIKKLILKNNGTRQDAEDVFQDALLVLINKIRHTDFVLSSSINTYLYSVCNYMWKDRLKQVNKTINSTIETASDEVSVFQEELKLQAKYKLAENAFSQLGKVCKELLILFYYKKLSLQQIAKQLHISSEKVAKNQKYRCLEKARTALTLLKTNSHD